MADQGVQIKKKRTFKKYTYRGVDLDQLLAIKSENLIELLGCRARRHFNRGIKRREENFLKRLRKVTTARNTACYLLKITMKYYIEHQFAPNLKLFVCLDPYFLDLKWILIPEYKRIEI